MSELDEFFAILTEDLDGPVKLSGKRYVFDSLALRNPDENSEELRQLLELAHEHVLQDHRPRLLVHYRGTRIRVPMDEVQLISSIPIGPVEEVLMRI